LNLSLKLITINEYHVLSESLLELGELLKAMDHTFKLKTSNPDPSDDESKSTGYWVLN
jgi:hypothetical protein